MRFAKVCQLIALAALAVYLLGCQRSSKAPGNPKSAKVEFRLVANDDDENCVTMKRKGQDETVKLEGQVVAGNTDIEGAKATKADTGGYQIDVMLSESAGRRMKEISTNNLRRQMAIVVDDEVISTPVIIDPVERQVVISGNFSKQEATAIAESLSQCEQMAIQVSAPDQNAQV
jgi:preprotein translocase subunit SecD